MSKTITTLEVVSENLQERVASARAHAQKATSAARVAVDEACLSGLDMLVLKAEFGETRGKKPTHRVFTETETWAEFVKREIGITDDTSRKWMLMAKGGLKMVGSSKESYLALPEMKRAKVIEQVQTESKKFDSQTDFIAQLYGVKPPIGHALEGDDVTRKYTKERKKKRTKEQITSAEFEALSKAALTGYRAAADKMLTTKGPNQEGPWDTLSNEDLKALKEQAHDLYKGILASETRRHALARKA